MITPDLSAATYKELRALQVQVDAALRARRHASKAMFNTPERAARIITETAKDHGLNRADMFRAGARGMIAEARFDAMWRLRQVRRCDGYQAYSLPHIAYLLGLRDHTSVFYGVHRWEEIQAARRVAAE